MKENGTVLNFQGLTTELLSDNYSLNPICPSNLLTVKSKVVVPPPSEFFDQIYIFSEKVEESAT